MPKEPLAKEIGRIAKDHFTSNKPLSWIVTDISGDEDYGLDYLVQFKNIFNNITYNFFVQLKGIKDKKRIKDNYLLVKLKAHTLNYYQNNGLILIVVCDINTMEYYYEYLHTILKELYGNERYFDNTEKEYSIKINKKNRLNKNLNIESVLESYAKGNHTNQREHAIKSECKVVKVYEDDKEDYETREYVNDNEFVCQKGRVYVNAFIPNNYDFSISMLIIFKLTDAEKAMITPNEETILKILFSGYKAKSNSTSRKWIVGESEGDFLIQVGNVRLEVPIRVIIDFSDIIDKLFEIYCEKIGLFEKNLKSKLFQVSEKYRDGYKIMKIKRGLWYLIHEFANKNGFNDGDSEWNIFGYDNYYLRVNFNDKKFIWSGNIIISPEPDNSYINYKAIDDEVVLVWNSLPYEKHERKNIEEIVLDVESVHKWIIEQLIPKVIYE